MSCLSVIHYFSDLHMDIVPYSSIFWCINIHSYHNPFVILFMAIFRSIYQVMVMCFPLLRHITNLGPYISTQVKNICFDLSFALPFVEIGVNTLFANPMLPQKVVTRSRLSTWSKPAWISNLLILNPKYLSKGCVYRFQIQKYIIT